MFLLGAALTGAVLFVMRRDLTARNINGALFDYLAKRLVPTSLFEDLNDEREDGAGA